MGKKKNTKKRCGKIILLVALCLILAAELCIFVIPQALYGQNDDPIVYDDGGQQTQTDAKIQPSEAPDETQEQTAAADIPVAETAAAAVQALEFPQTVDNGRLKIDMLFQFDGINPDCGDEEAEEIASVVVTNISDEYLEHAEISATMADGSVVRFELTNIPAGKSAMAFSIDNHTIDAEPVCVRIDCLSAYHPAASAEADGIAISVSGTEIVLENCSDNDISGITVYCHGLLGTEYFGGITYEYRVESLKKGESVTVNAKECFMGEAEVVRIEISEP